MPASNYYVLSAAVSIAFFFLVWGILRDEGAEMPWVTSGVGASILLAGAVILREVVLRRARNRYVRMERHIDERFVGVKHRVGERRQRSKLSLEQNSAILGEIHKKSNAAKVLNKFSAGHREVFEICGEYIERMDEELRTVSAGSPRFSAFLKGRKAAMGFHRYHLLRWAEIEARILTTEANNQSDIAVRVKAANDALGVIEYALESYPDEDSLQESREILRELAVSIKVSDLVENAQRAAFMDDHRNAMSLYRDALYFLGRDNVYTEERQQAADHVNAEIERLLFLNGGD